MGGLVNVPADALRIACNVRRGGTVSGSGRAGAGRKKRRAEAQGADMPPSKRRRPPVVPTGGTGGLVGPRLYKALSSVEGRAISQGGLSHYFLSEAFRRAFEVPEGGHRNPPASSRAIHMLPPLGASAGETCSICYDNIDLPSAHDCGESDDSAQPSKRLPCAHAYHTACIEHWLQRHNTCPCCRAEIETVCPIYNAAHKHTIAGEVTILPRDEQPVAGKLEAHERARRICQWPGMTSLGLALIRQKPRPLQCLETPVAGQI